MQLTPQATLCFEHFRTRPDAAVQLGDRIPDADLKTERKPKPYGWTLSTEGLFLDDDWAIIGTRKWRRELVITTERSMRGGICTTAAVRSHYVDLETKRGGWTTEFSVHEPPHLQGMLVLTRDDPDAGKRLTERKILGLHDRAMAFLRPYRYPLAAWALSRPLPVQKPAAEPAPKTRLTNRELWQALSEAEARKSDSSLPIDARVRSAETFGLCLREAHNRGFDYQSLKIAAAIVDG